MTFLELERRFGDVAAYEARWCELDHDWFAKRELTRRVLRSLKVNLDG